jgi:hypothetical protein
MGWVALRLYNHEGCLNSGSHLLGLWMEPNPRPSGTCINNLYNEVSAALLVEVDPRDQCILYSPEVALPDCRLQFAVIRASTLISVLRASSNPTVTAT